MTITFRKSNTNLLDRRASANMSSSKQKKRPTLSTSCTLIHVTLKDITLNLDASYSVVLIITTNGTSHSRHNNVSSSYYSCQHSSAILRPSSGKPPVFTHSDTNNHRTHTQTDISLKTTLYRCNRCLLAIHTMPVPLFMLY